MAAWPTRSSPMRLCPRTTSSSCRKWWNRRDIAAVEQARLLNAYVLETPEIALAQAAESDQRLARGEGRALEGIPLGIKDLFCTKGVRTTASSNILKDFKPGYESTV